MVGRRRIEFIMFFVIFWFYLIYYEVGLDIPSTTLSIASLLIYFDFFFSSLITWTILSFAMNIFLDVGGETGELLIIGLEETGTAL